MIKNTIETIRDQPLDKLIEMANKSHLSVKPDTRANLVINLQSHYAIHNRTVPELRDVISLLGLKRPTNISKLRKKELIEFIKLELKYKYSRDVICEFIIHHWHQYIYKKYMLLKSQHQNRECINETDFYTLEPLPNIPDNQFYSVYENGMWYGFNIFSLQTLIETRHRSTNPYTRKPFCDKTRREISQMILYLSKLEPEIININSVALEIEPVSSTLQNSVALTTRFLGNNIYPSPRSEAQEEMIRMLIQKRNRPLMTRIDELFIEIDLLDNFTQSRWLKELPLSKCVRLFHIYQVFWEHQSHFSDSVKWQVCSLTGDPFYNIFISNFNALTGEQIMEALVLVMENMVYTGIDTDARKLGALQVIIHLTYVSNDAKNSLSWMF
jgi:hypothetical protein